MLEIKNLEIHVTFACNLFCKSCSHFSNQQVGGNVSFERIATEMGYWSGRIKPKVFSILGGEPTLNKDLCKIVRECGRQWVYSDLLLVTNGFYLHKHPDLPKYLEDTDCKLDVSIHHQGEEYSKKVLEIKDLIDGWKAKYNFRLKYRPSSSTWRTTFEGYGANMVPWNDNEPEKSYQICNAKHCPQIFEGNIYKCPQLAYLGLMNKKYNLNESWKKYLNYRPLYPECSNKEMEQFFSQEVEPYCAMCPSYHRYFQIPCPLKNTEK